MSVMIIGGSSLIAKAAAENFAKNGGNILFAGRNREELEKWGRDFEIRYRIKTHSMVFDATDYASHRNFYHDALSMFPDIDTVYIGFGYLGEQSKAAEDWNEAQQIIDTNFTGAVSISNIAANDFEKKKKGTIIIVSSVAGERGRQSNYTYGSAKAGLTAYASGLRNRLFKSGVHVLTVKPGFVDTPMTYGMNLPKLLTASPQKVGKDIYEAAIKRKNVLYTAFYWRWIMCVVRSIPEFVFKRLKT